MSRVVRVLGVSMGAVIAAVLVAGQTRAVVIPDLFGRTGASATRPAVRLGPEFPTAESTGVGPGTALTNWTGPLSTNAMQAPTEVVGGLTCKVFDRYLVSLSGGSYLVVDSPCVIFRHSRFETSGVVSNTSAMVQQSGANDYMAFDWSEFDGGPSHQRGVQGDHSDIVVTHSKFTRFGQAGVEMNNRNGSASLTVTDSYFSETPGWPRSYHVDGIQVGGAKNVTIQHNTVLVEPYGAAQGDTSYVSNSALGLWAELGDVTGTVWVEGNLLAGGGRTIYLEQKSPFAWRGPVTVANNVFDQRFGPNGAIWGPLYPSGLPNDLSWFGNRWSNGSALTLNDALTKYP
ncbi:MAG TPA: hypothetical protein VH761_04430 [Ilumatobacteraceae bacterium]